MRLDPVRWAPSLATAERTLERAGREEDVLVPIAWPNAQVEAWLDWAAELPRDWPANAPAALGPDAPRHPLLGGGPDLYATRQAAWGLALGYFADKAQAIAFRSCLFDIFAAGLASPGPSLAFGARLHPLIADPVPSPPLSVPSL